MMLMVRARVGVTGLITVVTAALLGAGLTVAPVAHAARPAASATPALPRPERSLGGVSCVGASFCMGVGPYGDQLGSGGTFSQVWNGRAWRTVAVPSPSLAYGLLAVSCRSGKNCIAVGGQGYDSGGQLSAVWHGRTWKMLPAPSLPGHSQLLGVACPSAGQCVAVGTAGGTVLAQVWDGRSWSLTSPVVPAGSIRGSLTGISCSGPSSCVAVGQYFTAPGQLTGDALAESWDGSAWSLLPAPPGVSALNGVACPAAKVCVVVGNGSHGEFSVGSALWDAHDKTWTALSTPSPQGMRYTQMLTAVSCTSATHCIAVGSGPGPYSDGSGGGPLAEEWAGGTGWRLLRVPSPAAVDFAPDGVRWQQADGLAGVSCTGPARCVAVGGNGQTEAVSAYSSFAVSWNGRGWHVLRTGKVDGLMGVACARGPRCLATGTYLDKNDVTQTLAESWNGRRMRLALPRGLHGVLSAVSCPSASFCMVARESRAAAWNGKRWTWTGAISRTVNAGTINDLSCASRTFCMALGEPTMTVGEVWNGKKWHSAPLAVPRGSGVELYVTSLSCRRTNLCVAVGSWSIQRGLVDMGTLAQAWNGHRWRILKSPGRYNIEDAMNAVSCLTRTTCMAIGADQVYGKSSSFLRLFTASWNGRRWQVRYLAGRYSLGLWQAGVQGPSSLSCPTAASCVAVGSYQVRSPFSYKDIAWIWNGRSWRTTRPPGPAGITQVSCASASQCVAIGLPGLRTLAKLWNGRAWKLIRTINP